MYSKDLQQKTLRQFSCFVHVERPTDSRFFLVASDFVHCRTQKSPCCHCFFELRKRQAEIKDEKAKVRSRFFCFRHSIPPFLLRIACSASIGVFSGEYLELEMMRTLDDSIKRGIICKAFAMLRETSPESPGLSAAGNPSTCWLVDPVDPNSDPHFVFLRCQVKQELEDQLPESTSDVFWVSCCKPKNGWFHLPFFLTKFLVPPVGPLVFSDCTRGMRDLIWNAMAS